MKKVKILKLTDSKIGHENTTNSVIKAIGNIFPDSEIEVKTLGVKLRIKASLKILRILFNNKFLFSKVLNINNFLSVFYKFDEILNAELSSYDYVISSGGNTSFINIYLSKKFNIKNIYASQLRGLSPELFYLIVTIFKKDNFKNSILLDFPPLAKEAVDLNNDFLILNSSEMKKKIFTLLIGGNGAGYKYTKKDYICIINNFNTFLEINNGIGLISTSRRTGIENEKIIKKLISTDEIKYKFKYIIYFNIKAEFLLANFISLSDAVFVTEDSGSMLTEAILSNKDTYVIYTNKNNISALYAAFLLKINKYIITRINITDLDKYILETRKIKNIVSPLKSLEDKLIEYFKK
jgi:uncharacterized protein